MPGKGQILAAPLGLQQFQQSQPDMIILDVMLPGCNGFEVLKGIRKQSNVPVLMLTARGDEVDRIVGLEIGGDDLQRNVLLDGREGLQHVAAHVEIDLARQKQRPAWRSSSRERGRSTD